MLSAPSYPVVVSMEPILVTLISMFPSFYQMELLGVSVGTALSTAILLSIFVIQKLNFVNIIATKLRISLIRLRVCLPERRLSLINRGY